MKVYMPALAPYLVIQKLLTHHEVFAGCRTTVFLASGATIQGDLVTTPSGRKDISALVLQSADGAVTWIDANSIQAISLAALTPTGLSILSDGAVDPLDFEEAPSKLALQRHVKNQAEVVSEHLGKPFAIQINWDSLPDAKAMLALSQLLDDTVAILFEMTRDGFGKDQVLARCSKILFTPSEENEIHMDRDTLQIGFGWQPNQRWKKADLAERINNAF